MQDVVNYDTICDIIFVDDDGHHSKAWIWNDNDSNLIVTVHESYVALLFVYTIRRQYC